MPERKDPSVSIGCRLQQLLLRHQQTTCFSYSRCFVLSLRRAKLKSMSSDRVPFCCCVEGVFQQQSKSKSKERCSENAAFFDAAVDVEWLRGAATEQHYSVHARVEGLGHAL